MPGIWPVLALAGAYYGAAKFGYELEFSGPVAAIVWLPAGVGAAFLSLGGLRFWPGVLIGELLANDYAVLPLGSPLGQTGGEFVEGGVFEAAAGGDEGFDDFAVDQGSAGGDGADGGHQLGAVVDAFFEQVGAAVGAVVE